EERINHRVRRPQIGLSHLLGHPHKAVSFAGPIVHAGSIRAWTTLPQSSKDRSARKPRTSLVPSGLSSTSVSQNDTPPYGLSAVAGGGGITSRITFWRADGLIIFAFASSRMALICGWVAFC